MQQTQRKGVIAFVVATLAGTVAMVAGDLLFRDADPYIVRPITQACGFAVGSLVAWPLWERDQPERRVGILGYTASVLAVVILLATIRIAYRIG